MSDGNSGKFETENLPATVEETHADSAILRQELEIELKHVLLQAEIREAVIRRVITYAEGYRGPLPHPRHLAEFNRIVPGAAGRLLSMAEGEQRFRHAISREVVQAEAHYSRRGQYIALIVLLALVGAAIHVVSLGNTTVAGIIMGTGALGIVTAFLNGQIG